MRRFLLFLLLASALAGGAGFLVFERLLATPGPPLREPVRIDVASGETLRDVAGKLEASGLVPSADAVVLWGRLQGLDRRIQYGAYQFTEALRPIDLIEKMATGEVMLVRVTIPEGKTIRDIALALETAALGPAETFAVLARDREFARTHGVSADTLEGYLYPETYFFSPLDPPEKILRTMVERFREVTASALASTEAETGLTAHQIVTLASVIEKETGKSEERPLVAAVFRNRLKIGMPLQADPTVIYGIENFDGNLRRADLVAKTPYNTYVFAGLPPGPIANPGRQSIEAAIAPAAVPYLYFVAKDDGSHEFSTTLAEHNKAVNRWQRRRS